MHRYLRARTVRSRRQILDTAKRYNVICRVPRQLHRIDRLFHLSDANCVENIRMDRNTFARLCYLLTERGGLHAGKVVGVEEQVAMFLGVLAHHKKNRVVKFEFWRSGATVSYYVNKVLCAVLSLYSIFLAKSTPVSDDCADNRWKWFKVSFVSIFYIMF